MSGALLRLPCRWSFLAVTVALSCRGATPPSHDDPDDAAPPIWPRTDGGAPSAPLCKETHALGFEWRQADVLLLFDRSESMMTEFAPGTRYSVVASMLSELVDVYQDKLRFGFQQFPDGQACPADRSAGCCAGPPSVPVAISGASAIRAAIAGAWPPGGSTPTAEALLRAREYFAGLDDSTDHYVLLSTDGRPSCNAAGRLAEDVLDADGRRVSGPCRDALDQVDALVAAGVKVIVLGVGSGLQDDPGGLPGCLEEIARRGQGPAARPEDRPWFYSGADQEALELALQRIFGGSIRPACRLLLNAVPSDPGQVAVFLDGHQVPRHRNYGWDYESPDDTRRIHFMGEYCRRIDRFQVGVIEVRYGCSPCSVEAGQCE
jgi:hypothetical protein